MPKPKVATHTDQLRRLASSRNAEAFVERLRPLLLDDFPHWFAELKVQKLIGQFRSKAHVETIRNLLLPPEGAKAPLQKGEAEALAHHLDVCSFFQDLYDYIDAETAALSCRVAHPEIFLRTIVRVLEIGNYGFHRNMTSSIVSEGGATSLELSQSARRFRDLLDAGNAILCSKIARSGHEQNFRISDVEISKLFDLAYQYDEVRQVFDVYTYQDATCRLNRRSLILKKTSREAELAAAVGAERTSDFDQTRFSLLNMMEVKVQRECLSRLLKNSKSV